MALLRPFQLLPFFLGRNVPAKINRPLPQAVLTLLPCHRRNPERQSFGSTHDFNFVFLSRLHLTEGGGVVGRIGGVGTPPVRPVAPGPGHTR